MAGSIELKTVGRGTISCPYQGDDTMGIGGISRTMAGEHMLEALCDQIWRDEYQFPGTGSYNADVYALSGDWCGSAIAINLAVIHVVTIELETSNEAFTIISLSASGGVGGDFPLALGNHEYLSLSNGMFSMGSVLGWTAGTSLRLTVLNSGVDTPLLRMMIAGKE